MKNTDKDDANKENTASADDKEANIIPDEEPNKQVDKQTISIKEIAILVVGILVVFIVLFAIPHFFKEEPKSITELHMENFNAEESETNYIYNGFSFLKLPDPRTNRMFWYTQITEGENLFDLPMHYGPRELENVTMAIINPTEQKNYSVMYITVDPSEEDRPYLGIAIAELTEKLSKVKRYPLVSACTENLTIACETRPIVDCENAEDDIVVKIEETAAEPALLVDGNCFIIQGMNESLVQATDKMLFKFFGVI